MANNTNITPCPVTRQIALYQTDKGLLEITDKLKMASVENYARLHAFREKVETDELDARGELITFNKSSVIGLEVQDYSEGTGEKNKIVTCNISPDEAAYFFHQAANGVQEFSFGPITKIFGPTDMEGRAQMTKLTVGRAIRNKNGSSRSDYPWFVSIENGTGIKMQNKMGGSYCKKDSYKCDCKAHINISDLEFFKCFRAANSYISAWEAMVGSALIPQGIALYEEWKVQFVGQRREQQSA